MSRQPADATAATALDLRFGQVGLLQARLRSLDPGAVIDELSGRIASAPQFFRSTAVCLDLASLPQLPAVADVRPVIDAVRRAGMIVVGVADGVPGAEELAKSLGLPVLAGFRAAQQSVAQVRAAAAATAAASAAAARVPEPPAPPPAQSGLVHPQPVRSGQRVYARDRDLIVLGTVGAGAEVMADGCVHVYGTLRGRAMAGCRGDAGARLFAREFRAELVAIAGVFRVFEKLPPDLDGQSIMAWLDGEELRIARLGA